ncbi:helix-hairpin-helix domain-containing protein [Micromonospora chalcea]|uniref:helix-hairpin-helix domain-containing protein n=1 Tax=Micromonospora chalcea TaxID=1874 RepID=UPI00157D8F60|nr:helix-hairpin-helix domain-containing protein [Micromonospora chalcea]
MPSSFGQWLFVILALLIGLVVGWVLFGRRPGAQATPTVESTPVVTATVDEQRPVAVVDEPPATATATVTEPAPAESATAEPAVATAARSADEPAESSPVASEPVVSEPAVTEPVAAEPVASEPVVSEPVAAEPVASERVGSEPVTAEPVVSEPVTAEPVAAEPVAAEPIVSEPAASEPAPATVDSDPVTVPATVDAEPVAASATLVEDEPVAEKQPAVGTAVDAPVEATEPVAVPAPRTSVENVPAAADTDAADDFRRIQGIGPKLAAALQDAGIRTYRQLAELDEAALRQTVKAAGLRSAPGLATWPQQAKVLAGAGADAERVLPAGAE